MMSSSSGKVPTTRLARFSLSRLPAHSTLARLWSLRRSSDRGQRMTTEFQEGGLLWAKIPGYPIWPCMVTRDPFTNQFVKHSGDIESHDVTTSCSYHVQYFGVGGERSWVKDESLMAFKGRQAFIDKAREAPYKYKITGTWIQRLNFAIAQADKALLLPKNARKRRFTLKYVFGPSERSLQRVLDNHFRHPSR